MATTHDDGYFQLVFNLHIEAFQHAVDEGLAKEYRIVRIYQDEETGWWLLECSHPRSQEQP